MQTAAFGLRWEHLSLEAVVGSVFDMTRDIEVILAAITQHINHIAGRYVERTDNTSSKVEATVGAKDYVRAACYSE